MTPERQARVREVHPELAFAAMNGGAALAESKHTDVGAEMRTDLLDACGLEGAREAAETLNASPGLDDVLDAHAVCWTARRIANGAARRLPAANPEAVPTNDRGLRMEIWY
jgi:predicted RNase H-like nuclease